MDSISKYDKSEEVVNATSEDTKETNSHVKTQEDEKRYEVVVERDPAKFEVQAHIPPSPKDSFNILCLRFLILLTT